MIYANFAPYLLGQDPPLIFRLFSSLSAPLFIFTSGYSTMLGKSGFFSKITSSLLILVTASLIDIFVWGIWPFQTFDVLYVISISLVVIHILPLKRWGWLIMALMMLLLSFIARFYLGYRFTMEEHFVLDGYPSGLSYFSMLDSLVRLLVDGWFPLLPWMGMAFLGRFFAQYEVLEMVKISNFKWVFPTVFILACLTIHSLPAQPMRDGYVELFYPPTLPYLLLSLSWIGMVFLWFPSDRRNLLLSLCTNLGRKSLFVYLFHSVIAHFILDRYVFDLSMALFLLLTTLLTMAIYLVVSTINRLDDKGFLNPIPWQLRRVFGL